MLTGMIHKRMRMLSAVLIATLLLGPAVFVHAEDDREAARRLQQEGTILALEVILHKALDLRPGRVLEVEFKTRGERYLYEVEILDENGVVHELYLDARNAALLKIEKEH